jgi:hypothetical protein
MVAHNCLFCQSFELPETLNKDNIDPVYSHFVNDREAGKLPETISCPYCGKSGMMPDSFLRHFRGHKTPLVTQNRTLSFRASPVENASASVNVPAAKEEPPIAAPTQRADSSETNQKNPNTLEEDGNVMADNSTQNTGYFVISKEALEKKIDATLETLNRLTQQSSQSDQDPHRHSLLDMLNCRTCGPLVKSLVSAELEDSIADDVAKTKHLHKAEEMLQCPDCRPKVLSEAARILQPLVEVTRSAPASDTKDHNQEKKSQPEAPRHQHVTADVLSCPECRKTLLASIKSEGKSGSAKDNDDDEHKVHSDVDSLLKCPYCGPQVILAVLRTFNRNRGDTAT